MRVPLSLLLPATVLGGAALVGACTSPVAPRANRPVGTTVQAPVRSTTATAPATTASPTTAPVTTTVYAPTAPQASPYGAASRLMTQWSNGDRASAASVAAPAAVQKLFSITYPAGWLQFRGCTASSTDPGTCTYRNTETNAIYEVTVTRSAAGWYVSAVIPES